jgi:hypothetical protein
VERAKKKNLYIVVVAKATTHVGKPPRLLTYLCHIFGIVKHNMINCQKFDKMQTVFKDKGGKITKNKHIVEVKMVNALVNTYKEEDLMFASMNLSCFLLVQLVYL